MKQSVREYVEARMKAAYDEMWRQLEAPHLWLMLYRDPTISDKENWKRAYAAIDSGWRPEKEKSI